MGKRTKSNQSHYKDQVRLLRSWLNYFCAETESWEIQNVGSHIAYLCKAVLDNDSVQWPEDNPVLRLILKKDPARKAGIWKFIEVVPRE